MCKLKSRTILFAIVPGLETPWTRQMVQPIREWQMFFCAKKVQTSIFLSCIGILRHYALSLPPGMRETHFSLRNQWTAHFQWRASVAVTFHWKYQASKGGGVSEWESTTNGGSAAQCLSLGFGNQPFGNFYRLKFVFPFFLHNSKGNWF